MSQGWRTELDHLWNDVSGRRTQAGMEAFITSLLAEKDERITELEGALMNLKEDKIHSLGIEGDCSFHCYEVDGYPGLCQERVIDEALTKHKEGSGS